MADTDKIPPALLTPNAIFGLFRVWSQRRLPDSWQTAPPLSGDAAVLDDGLDGREPVLPEFQRRF